jgi:hypothetical protein
MLPLPLRALILLSNWTEIKSLVRNIANSNLIAFCAYKSMYSLLFLPLTDIDSLYSFFSSLGLSDKGKE